MATCLITFSAVDPQLATLPGAKLVFTPYPDVIRGAGNQIMTPNSHSVTADGSGAGSIALAPGQYQLTMTATRGQRVAQITVPDAETALLGDLVDATFGDWEFSELQALRAETRAWAENAEDVPVLPGLFSALHWAQKAWAWAQAAAQSAINAALYDPTRRYPSFSIMMASTRAATAEGTEWRAGRYRYVEANPSTPVVNGYPLVTAGGVKLLVEPELGGFDLRAFGAPNDLSGQATAALRTAFQAASGTWHPAIYAPSGLYLIDPDPAVSPKLTEGVTLYGDGSLNSQFVLMPKAGTFLARQRNIGSANTYINGVTIRDIGVIFQHPATAAPSNYRQIAFDFHSITRSTIKNCFIGNYPFGVSVGIIPRPANQSDARQGIGVVTSSTSDGDVAYAGGEVNAFRDILMAGVQRGITGDDPQFFNPSASSAAYAVVCDRVEVQIAEVGIAQWSQYGAGWTIKDCVFQALDRARGSSNTTYGIYLNGWSHTVIGGYNESPAVDHDIFLASSSKRNRIYPRLVSLGRPITDNGTGNVIENIDRTTNQWSMRINRRTYDEHGFATAWASFWWNGTSIEIFDSYNVASITRVGAGDFNVVFGTAMVTNNYTVSGAGSANASANPLLVHVRTRGGMSTAGCRVITRNLTTGTNVDPELVSVVFHGGQ